MTNVVDNNESSREIVRESVSSRAKLGPSMEVSRVLPSPNLEAVGPFVFFDHVGPMACPDQTIAPHPHAGIEVITYLIEGTNTHEDSMGNTGRVTSGGLQWITAGRGILHKERIVPETAGFHAVQLWTRLPKALEDLEPSYRTVRPEDVPERVLHTSKVRLLAGHLTSLFEEEGPLRLAQPTFLAHLDLLPGTTMELLIASEHELGIYTMTGQVEVLGRQVKPRTMALLGPGKTLRLGSVGSDPSSVLIMGGERAERPIVIYGSFVFDSKEAGARAMRDYAMGHMGAIDGVPF